MSAPDSPARGRAPVTPRIIPRSDHTVSRSSISPNALRVLYRLKDAGYQAFLVGGCVRDILLGRTPKDFDVATNALPDEVRELFRNCRLVGRRFRLAHVVFGREIIEVATFRASSAPDLADEPLPDADPEEGEAPELDAPDFEEPAGFDAPPERRHDRAQDESGRILRDNVYGTIDEDVWRRDFTANALYYNIADFSIWDYCGGVEDVHERRLRLIGDPETRYREDPVRMLRAARFEAKLGFQLDAPGLEPMARLRTLLTGVPAARLFDEMVKLFLTGHGAESLAVLRRHRLLEVLLPAVERYLARHPEPGREAAGAGARQHRRARRRGQAGDARVPAGAAALRADRGPHRAPAARALARGERDPRRLRRRAARGARARHDPQAHRLRRARHVRAAAAARASARPALAVAARSSRASAPPTTCCCCARSRASRRVARPSGGRSRRPPARRARAHGRGHRATPARSPTARARVRGRGPGRRSAASGRRRGGRRRRRRGAASAG
ncbi:MAG: polynucleotide adenylyltransferase PcnB [Steroidobacteraceae bacterium]